MSVKSTLQLSDYKLKYTLYIFGWPVLFSTADPKSCCFCNCWGFPPVWSCGGCEDGRWIEEVKRRRVTRGAESLRCWFSQCVLMFTMQCNAWHCRQVTIGEKALHCRGGWCRFSQFTLLSLTMCDIVGGSQVEQTLSDVGSLFHNVGLCDPILAISILTLYHTLFIWCQTVLS